MWDPEVLLPSNYDFLRQFRCGPFLTAVEPIGPPASPVIVGAGVGQFADRVFQAAEWEKFLGSLKNMAERAVCCQSRFVLRDLDSPTGSDAIPLPQREHIVIGIPQGLVRSALLADMYIRMTAEGIDYQPLMQRLPAAQA